MNTYQEVNIKSNQSSAMQKSANPNENKSVSDSLVPEQLIQRFSTNVMENGYQDSRKSYSPPPVIQRIGERAAIRKTMVLKGQKANPSVVNHNLGLRRGNRRGSVVNTQRGSHYWMVKMRENINNLIVDFINQFGITRVHGCFRDMIKAQAFSAIGAGNCSEFSVITFSSLLTDTTGQWVYNCCFNDKSDWDHVFTITSPVPLTKGLNTPGVDYSKLVVVDGWDSYRITYLPDFLERFDSEINSIRIMRGSEAGILQPFTHQQQQFIEDWVNDLKANDIAENDPDDFTTEEDVEAWCDKHGIYGEDNSALPRTIIDGRSSKDQFQDLEESNLHLAFKYLKTKTEANIQMVAIKLLSIDSNLLSTFLDFVENSMLRLIPTSVTAVLFTRCRNLRRQKDYIDYLKGKLFGFTADNKAIEEILLCHGNEELYDMCKGYTKKKLPAQRNNAPILMPHEPMSAPGRWVVRDIQYGDEKVPTEVFEEEKQ